MWRESQRDTRLQGTREGCTPPRKGAREERVKVAGRVSLYLPVLTLTDPGSEASPMRVPMRRWVQDALLCLSHLGLSGGWLARWRLPCSRRVSRSCQYGPPGPCWSTRCRVLSRSWVVGVGKRPEQSWENWVNVWKTGLNQARQDRDSVPRSSWRKVGNGGAALQRWGATHQGVETLRRRSATGSAVFRTQWMRSIDAG